MIQQVFINDISTINECLKTTDDDRTIEESAKQSNHLQYIDRYVVELSSA